MDSLLPVVFWGTGQGEGGRGCDRTWARMAMPSTRTRRWRWIPDTGKLKRELSERRREKMLHLDEVFERALIDYGNTEANRR